MAKFKVTVTDQDKTEWSFNVTAVCKRDASRQADLRIRQMIGSGCKPPLGWTVTELADSE